MKPDSTRGRLSILWGVISAACVVLGLRLAQLQILDAAYYRDAAERNRSQIIYQTAPRGRFYDRHGEVLAENRGAFTLIFLPGKNRVRRDLEPLARELGRQLGQDPGDLLVTLEQAERDQSAARLAENLPPATAFRLWELKTIYPGIVLIEEARRYYPYGRFASHLLGYMGKMSPREWRNFKARGYRADQRIGKMGLEALFEDDLRGRDGGRRMEVDAQGRIKRELENIPWEAGSNVYLTLDAAVQRAADEGLRESVTGRGAAVAIDPRNGDILAMSSQPDFDPNALLSVDAKTGRPSAGIPEFNNAIAGTYPPGSTFKPIVGLAAFAKGASPDEEYFCPGYYQLGNRRFKCWVHKGHGRVGWFKGLEESCDVYFYNLGLKTGGAEIERYERMFGLGERTNISLRGEKSGHRFGPRQRGKEGKGWYDGDTLNLSIGQGELTVTPLQMAVVTAALANRGQVWRPHFTRRIVYADGRPDFVQHPELSARIDATPRAWDLVQRAMEIVVSSGTGKSARVPGLVVAGKTGTAQNAGGKDHAWFIVYAGRPGEPAKIAVAVLVANGGHGGVSAAPVARRMILARFGLADAQDARAPRPAAPGARPAPPPEILPAGAIR